MALRIRSCVSPVPALALALLAGASACGKSNEAKAPASASLGAATAGRGGEAPAAPRYGAITVAAAADLTNAFEEVGKAFEAKHAGARVTFKFGSTGQLAQQIKQGAPFDVFAAANVSFVDDVVAAGACDGATKAQYARGRIVLWSKRSGVAPATSLADLGDARFAKIAIANPEHAPYGKAAKEAMASAKIYDTVKGKLVFGENIKQTLQFAETGNAEVAVVALSLAIVGDGGYIVIDDGLHEPLDQALAVCKGDGSAETARAFATFIGSDEGRAIMKKFGFLMPGETPPTK
jgi:molybdate transport system substrate-binding protein